MNGTFHVEQVEEKQSNPRVCACGAASRPRAWDCHRCHANAQALYRARLEIRKRQATAAKLKAMLAVF